MSLKHQVIKDEHKIDNLYRMCLSSMKFVTSQYAKSVLVKLAIGLSQVNERNLYIQQQVKEKKNLLTKETDCQTEDQVFQKAHEIQFSVEEESNKGINVEQQRSGFPVAKRLFSSARKVDSCENIQDQQIIEQTIQKYEMIIQELQIDVEELKKQTRIKDQEMKRLQKQNQQLKISKKCQNSDCKILKQQIHRLQCQLRARDKEDLKKKMKQKQVRLNI